MLNTSVLFGVLMLVIVGFFWWMGVQFMLDLAGWISDAIKVAWRKERGG